MAEWIAIGLIALGMIASWVRNSQSQSKDYGALKRDVENIQKMLDSSEFGLNALQKQISLFKEHCASVSGRLSEKAQNLEKRVEQLQSKNDQKESTAKTTKHS